VGATNLELGDPTHLGATDLRNFEMLHTLVQHT
jgi:hypothetical protein